MADYYQSKYSVEGESVVGMSYRAQPGRADISGSTDTVASTARMVPPSQIKAETIKTGERVVGFTEIFRFADCVDILMMCVGTLGAIVHGAGIVAVVVVLGDMIDLFITDQKAKNQIADLLATGNYTNEFGNVTLTSQMIQDNTKLIDPIAIAQNSSFNSTYLDTDLAGGELLVQMRKFAIYFCIIGAAVFVCAYGQVAFYVLSAERQVRKVRTAFFRAVMRQEIGWYDCLGSGELNTRLTDDMNKIVDGIGDKLGSFIMMVTAFVAGFVVGFIYGWKLTLVIAAICPILVLAALILAKINSALTSKELKAYAKAGKVAEEVLGFIRTVAAFGGEKKECQRYDVNLLDAKKKGVRKGMLLGLGMGFSWLSIYAVYALGFWYGAKLIRDEPVTYSAGTLMIVFFAVVTGAFAIGNAAPNLQALTSARGAAFAIFNIIDNVPKIDSNSEEGLKPRGVIGNIEFKNIYFRYPSRPDVQVLNGMNLKVSVGQTVALVGSSGCGKSTSVALMQRFYDPLSGDITIDGNNIRDLNVKWLRQHIGIVSQEPVLFATTIAENIAYGRDGVTQAEIEMAAKEANAHNFIMQFPDRYNTLVGQRGAQMSGGQKQRIAIARALVRNPKILLLDEATSALDTESERTVQIALDKAREGRTTIVIAHRLSTIRTADQICAFKAGVVVEQGNHEQMMEKKGIYYSLVSLQTRISQVEGDQKTTEDDDDEAEVDKQVIEKKIPEKQQLSRGGSLRNSLRNSLRGLRRLAPGSVSRTAMSAEDEDAMDEMAEEVKTDENPSFQRILRMNAPEWPYILTGCIAALINGGEQPVFAVIFSELLNVFTDTDLKKQERDAQLYSLIFVGIGVVILFTQWIQGYMFGLSGEQLTMRLRGMTFKAMLRQEIAWFDDHTNNTGALCTRLATDASSVQGATGSRLGMIVQNIANIGTGLVIAFIFGWKLSLVILAFIPLIVLCGAVETRVLTGVANKDKKALEKAGKVALEAIENIRTVAGLTREQTFFELYNEMLEEPYQNSIKKAHIYGVAFSFSQAVIYFSWAAAFTFGAYQIQIGEMTFDNVFKVFAAIVFGAMALGQTAAFAPDYSKARNAAGRIFKLLDRTPTIDSQSDVGTKIHSFTGEIEFTKVRFRYPTRPEVPILRGLNISVKPGETLALVGSSGCGKSTSVQLIERFYDPLSGNVYLDGRHEIRDVPLGWLRSQIGIVSQEPTLFDCTIAENIAYGDNSRQVPMNEVIDAARNSNIHNFIMTLPQGYDTMVGDKGTQLSGGQKQRVAIARALVRNPRILLLDEATSALDTESEKIVQEALDKARAGRTCVVIAHRLSTIRDADRIVVIHSGKVVESGKHDELMALERLYYNLNVAQTGAH
ncbi:unnamed protein product [Owenia fusiformis]|uniref:Uncharacterized protein n=1 Tax=Owenia fusiformis TaxID=6347 RepID=A0A8J1Y5B4_OWEFU|nr:unnamed protein product [Owenia fusiformis]